MYKRQVMSYKLWVINVNRPKFIHADFITHITTASVCTEYLFQMIRLFQLCLLYTSRLNGHLAKFGKLSDFKLHFILHKLMRILFMMQR